MAIPLLDHTARSLDENLALDEALLLAAEAGTGGEVLRFWEWPGYAVVLGAGGSVRIDVNEDACRADGVTIHRRASGGGTVLLGRGCLLFTLVLSYEGAPELRDVTASYRWILGRVCKALRPLIPLEHGGISDLVLNGRKVSGNAQQRKGRYLLHHGTLLYDFGPSAAARYLHPPEREPAYRAGRQHEEFLTNLAADSGQLKQLLTIGFDAVPGAIADGVADRVPAIVQQKYERADWVYRR